MIRRTKERSRSVAADPHADSGSLATIRAREEAIAARRERARHSNERLAAAEQAAVHLLAEAEREATAQAAATRAAVLQEALDQSARIETETRQRLVDMLARARRARADDADVVLGLVLRTPVDGLR